MRFPWGYELAIDLGTANTHICVKGAGVVVREPSMIAYDGAGRRPIAVGLEARRMLERDVQGVHVLRPIRGGVVADFDATVAMLRHLLHRALGRRPLITPRVIAALPNQATDVERRALADALHAAGGGEIIVVDKSLAAALGAGVRVEGDATRLVVDLGAGATSVGLVAMGMATTGTVVRFGGDDLDELIRRNVKRAQGIQISPTSAEQAKLQVGTLLPPEHGSSLRVDGIAGESGTPATADVALGDVPEMLVRGLNRPITEIAWLLEELPPSQRAEVAANGAVLTGGGALLGAVDAYLAEKLGIPVQVATDPASCTILGLEAMLNEPHAISLGGRRFRAPGTQGR